MPPSDLIVIAGAPGSGKSTLAEALRRRLRSPLFEFSLLREVHMVDDRWSNAGPEEEAMAFENLVFVMNNYFRHGYRNVILTDLTDERVQQIPAVFASRDLAIFTLTTGEAELRRRVGARQTGFTNVEAALAWNQAVKSREVLPCETKIAADGLAVGDITDLVLAVLTHPTAEREREG